ncbi:pyridoxal phosphate-dependent aminotransferase [Mongoliitalea daihaiensis]|uniref:pyridoxal phosphate-dependent aminotransferase n=1 Tax=Mongoliitalea daihaiensis TaxID=2782006 RepID=UPI001F25ACC7|nr:aminotransferase class I/II-fold pyridoxal phosphate-dependent enzyme [Mongoliitalea daihaiensis]UJP64673.1 aminotransferase class I/II-fold pyridoxal phosphate-dependent enzyme [Mongoliitalea daihaiensis]
MKGFAERLKHTEEYYFSKKLKEVQGLIAAGKPIIHMGIGSPDGMPDASVIQAITQSVENPANHGYQAYQGIPALRKAMADFYQSQYGVTKDHTSEVLPLMGSKEGIMHASLAFLNPGDQVLIPNPGYPTYSSVARLLQAEPISYALKASYNYWPDFDALEALDLSKVKIMFANYPHMPSGAKADVQLFEKLLAFCQKHQLVLIHDNPYSHVLEEQPKSIFQVDGAKEVALELTSLSKSSNMAGWRVGMLVGRADWVQVIATVKSNMDSGMLKGIQEGAVQALVLGNDWYQELNKQYGARKKLIFQLLDKLGWGYSIDTAGLFVWAQVPHGVSATEACDQLLYEKNIFTTPGTVFGSEGEGYVRFSLCVTEEKIQEAINRL